MAETAKTLKKLLMKRIDVPIYVWGPPGIGKSDVIKQVGKELGVDVIDIRLSLMDPTDLRGVPMVIDGEAKWVKPSFLPKNEDSIMFFDELNHAPPSVQSAAYQIILDGRIGEHTLPDNTIRIAAGNQKGDGILGYDLPLPLKNRFVHIEMRCDSDAWLEWAEKEEIDSRIIAFIYSKPELLMDLPKGQDTQKAYGFPTPRSWAFASTIIKGAEDLNELRSMVEGAIGKKTASIFLTHIRMVSEYKSPQFILDNPTYIDKDLDRSILWSILSSVAHIVTQNKIDEFTALMSNPAIPAELTAYTFRLATNKYNKRYLLTSELVNMFLSKEEVALSMGS